MKHDLTDQSVKRNKVINNILYYENPIKHRLLISIPQSMVWEVLYSSHDLPMSGQLGIDKINVLKMKIKKSTILII